MGKTNPLNDADLAEFVEMQRTQAEGPKSWVVRRGDLDEEKLDLGVRNPHEPEAEPERAPAEIIDCMRRRNVETAQILRGLRAML